MAFNPVQINPIDLNPNKAVGINIPFNGNDVFISNYTTKEAIKNNLINFFLTNPGDRYLNPEFGGGLRPFIFEQMSLNSLGGLKDSIQFKIKNFFPQVNVISLELSQTENTLILNLYYEIINTNINDTIEIEF
jgi:phage baseplate assembly protein W